MKDLSELKFPEHLRYAQSHEWIAAEGAPLRVGITEYAQDQLGDIVFVELPEPGKSLAKGAAFGSVESVKAVSEIYMPVAGKVVAVNGALEDTPELVNTSPYEQGWMIAIEPDAAGELEALLDSRSYRAKLEG
jgi:glycine cleavage system H protein